jgi:L-ribulose-5-phosphate 3-epimerase
MRRRDFLRSAALAAGASALGACRPGSSALGSTARAPGAAADLYSISLAQWSLHRTIRAGELDPMDFPAVTRERYGLEGVEYVNQFYADRVGTPGWAAALRRRADDAGVRSLLIMCDGEGALGDPDEGRRAQAVENHRKWLDAATVLGCHSIRVNAQSSGTREEQARLAADGLRRLSELGDQAGLYVIVENHGGLSSDGAWLADVMRRVDHPRVGTLPDFGNFMVSAQPEVWYDRYRGVEELMPFARAVSAKSHAFDANGNETATDYRRMMRIVLDAGYRGWVGIEYEGEGPEHEGILATRRLLERVREELAPRYAAP